MDRFCGWVSLYFVTLLRPVTKENTSYFLLLHSLRRTTSAFAKDLILAPNEVATQKAHLSMDFFAWLRTIEEVITAIKRDLATH